MAVDKKQRDRYAVGTVLVLLVVVITANLVAELRFWRLDLTAEQRYSLSAPFHNILNRLEDPLKITYYSSEVVPAQFEFGKRAMLDKLREIETAAGGKILLEIKDPTKDTSLREKLHKESELFEVTVQSVERDQRVRTTFYSGFHLLYQEKDAVPLQRVFDPDELEYLLGSRILTLTLKEKPLIAIHIPKSRRKQSPNPMLQNQGSFEWFAEAPFLDEKFEKKVIEFAPGGGIPANTKLLICVRPKDLSEQGQCEVAKFLAQGGRALFLASPWEIDFDFRKVTPLRSGLEDYFKDLGVAWVSALVLDESSVALPGTKIERGSVKPHPVYVKIQPQGLSQENPVTRFLPGLAMPYTSAFILDEDKAKAAGLDIEVLARTSKRTWTVPLPAFLDLVASMEKPTRFDNPRPVLVQLQGQFPCAWEGKPEPGWPDETGKPKPLPSHAKPLVLNKLPGTVFLYSCPESFHQFFLETNDPMVQQQFVGNGHLLLNVVETAALGDDLLAMRTKTNPTRAIHKFEGEGEDRKRNLIKAGMIALIPGFVVLFALCYWWWRRGTQMDYEREFSTTIGPSSFTPERSE